MSAMSYISVNILKTKHSIVNFKWANCIEGKLHLNETIIIIIINHFT